MIASSLNIYSESTSVDNNNLFIACEVCDYYDDCTDAEGDQAGSTNCDDSEYGCHLLGAECGKEIPD